MIKKIKTENKLNLLQLINNAAENKLGDDGEHELYVSDCSNYQVHVSNKSLHYIEKTEGIKGTYVPDIPFNTNFTVETEMDIDEGTIFPNMVAFIWDDITKQYVYVTGSNDNILGMKAYLNENQELIEILVPIDNKSTTIWEREEE